MKKAILIGVALASAAGIGYAAGAASGAFPDISTLNPKAIKALLPADIKWVPAEGLQGTDTFTLFGSAASNGFYIVLNRFHPGNFSRPHYHANDRYVMVLDGTWWASTGAKYDPNSTVPMREGTFALHTGKEVHYDGARAGEGEAIVMIFGIGPGARHECEGPRAETGPGPCADAKRAAGVN
ncbi:MAG: hypothetical protein EXR00_09965 [Alphaproteobacteria bacterium]|nr:hypothetical protein [Alphaproteobacteria bacterium]